MIEAHLIQNGCLKIMNMNRVFNDVIAKFIRFTINNAWFNTTTCHPDSKATGMMITTIIILCQFSLGVTGSTKFTTPNHQGLIQQSPLF